MSDSPYSIEANELRLSWVTACASGQTAQAASEVLYIMTIELGNYGMTLPTVILTGRGKVQIHGDNHSHSVRNRARLSRSVIGMQTDSGTYQVKDPPTPFFTKCLFPYVSTYTYGDMLQFRNTCTIPIRQLNSWLTPQRISSTTPSNIVR